MTRTILTSVAVLAMLAVSTITAVSQATLGGQQPVPCDCTNCSAEHCPKPGSHGHGVVIDDFVISSFQTGYMKTTWERHLSTGARNPPPPDCPRLHPIAVCRASWQ
jgi:hypothetical protein